MFYNRAGIDTTKDLHLHAHVLFYLKINSQSYPSWQMLMHHGIESLSDKSVFLSFEWPTDKIASFVPYHGHN